MDEEIFTELQCRKISRCEVCSKHEAKYTCPRCELRTCCLECVKIHKKELECNGLRDKVKFKLLKNFNNIDLLNDYRLLEETARAVSKPVKLPAKSCYNDRFGTLPTDLYRLKRTALARKIQLHFLPPSFTRHSTNTSYLDYESQHLYWRIDWVFPQAGNITLTDEKVVDSTILSACMHKYIDAEVSINPALTYYQAAGCSAVKLLLKAERTKPDRYYLLDPTTTLRENLEGKSIVEYPVIYVILNYNLNEFNVLSEEEEESLKKRQRRRIHLRKKHEMSSKNNFLFSNTDDGNVESMEEINQPDDVNSSITEEHNDSEEHYHKDPNLSYHRRGRGRGRGGGRGYHFKNKWNQRNRQGMHHSNSFLGNDGNDFQ
uniref:Box C/D snoRNA protein 1 n=2 Tax=Graphocephala atropunctata TaxID=36148 RepID=A0A1B6MMI0_9HEMI